MLNQRQIEQFKQDGYCVIDKLLDEDQIRTLKNRALAIVRDADIRTLREAFSTHKERRNLSEYFLNSAESVQCFLEESALEDLDYLKNHPELSVNKIGHAMHELDDVFREFSRDSRYGQIARELGIEMPQIRQSMYIFKQPHIGGEVNWHQDATFMYTEPNGLLACWFALDDATKENGCLWVEPGGHNGPLRERFYVKDQYTTEQQQIDDTPWPQLHEAQALEVRSGTLVLMHGNLPHYSAVNTSSRPRHAYTLHIIDGRCHYAKSNWLQSKLLQTYTFP